MEYYSAIKMNEILPFATTWMNLEGIRLGEVSQTEKDKYHVPNAKDKYQIPYAESKRINEETKQKNLLTQRTN